MATLRWLDLASTLCQLSSSSLYLQKWLLPVTLYQSFYIPPPLFALLLPETVTQEPEKDPKQKRHVNRQKLDREQAKLEFVVWVVEEVAGMTKRHDMWRLID